MQPGIFYVWCSFLSSVSTRRIIPTNFVLALVPSAVSSIILVGMSLPVTNFHTLQMMAADELSTTNGNTSVSQAKILFVGTLFCKNVYMHSG